TGSVTFTAGTLPAGITASTASPGTTSAGTIVLTASLSASPSTTSVSFTASGAGVSSVQGSFGLTITPVSISVNPIAAVQITKAHRSLFRLVLFGPITRAA